MKVSINVIGDNEKIIWGLPAYLGTITLGDFSETIYVPIQCWNLEDYLKQWRSGLERIKTENKSCLVATVQCDKQTTSLINWWLMYKHGNKVIIENRLHVSENIIKLLKGRPFTPETCYQFIPRMSRRKDVSKWVVDLE